MAAKKTKKTDKKNQKARRFLLTFLNPEKHGESQDSIKKACILMGPRYFCSSQEIGNQRKTPHIHVYIIFDNPRAFTSIKKTFPSCHIDDCVGTDLQCIDYVFKVGEWLMDPKGDTNLRNTHQEWGERPVKKEKIQTTVEIKKMADEGRDAYEICNRFPTYSVHVNQIKGYINLKEEHEHKIFLEKNRKVKVVYIFGEPGTGKSNYVRYAHPNVKVCVASDYKQPFEQYEFNAVMIFEEFRSDIPCKQMLQYLDKYPVSLPHRYGNKFACYNTVYIISNLPLEEQYTDIQKKEPQTWKALLRRINVVMKFEWSPNVTSDDDPPDKDKIFVYNSVEDYFNKKFQTLKEFEEMKYEQTKLV